MGGATARGLGDRGGMEVDGEGKGGGTRGRRRGITRGRRMVMMIGGAVRPRGGGETVGGMMIGVARPRGSRGMTTGGRRRRGMMTVGEGEGGGDRLREEGMMTGGEEEGAGTMTVGRRGITTTGDRPGTRGGVGRRGTTVTGGTGRGAGVGSAGRREAGTPTGTGDRR